MSHSISIDGTPVTVEAEPGDTILDALLMAGVGFSYSCQAGNCGTCRCELVSGDVLELEYSEHALDPADRARGLVLACRTQVWGDTVIRKLDEEEFIVHPSRILQCTVASLDRLTHDILRLRLDIRAGGPFSFSAGQYASIEFPFAPGRARDYSMANRPDEPGLEFHIREMAGGSVSAGLAAGLRPGDAVRVSGPFGTSYLRANHTGPVIAIAGGSGLAPVRSIVAAMRAQGLANPVHAYFGARAERDVYGEAEMRTWVAGHAGSSAHVVLSDPDAEPGIHAGPRRFGFVTDAVAADFARLEGFKAYVAGPPAMVDAATAVLTSRGVPPRDIHADAFHPATNKEGAT
jgi:ferredoxin-NAD(P)+ reductase (naphthalene dioxygenase ferredoxin-specific)